MAHKQLEDGRVVVDWTTGDPEGDRKHLMSAYRDFLIEVQSHMKDSGISYAQCYTKIEESFKNWGIKTGNQVDDFPRIWIKIPD